MSSTKVAPAGTANGGSRLRPYPAYKDSGVEWLGQIPPNWSVRKWRYCCHVTQGQVPPDDDRYRDRVLIAPNHIESGTGRILFTETADEQGATSGKFLVKPADIIYSKIRPALNKACIATGHWLCSADMYPVAVSTDDLTPKYVLYFILSEPFVRLMVDESMRVAMPKVNRETVADCPLLIPPLKEQEGIVRHLDRETARVAGLVAKKERLIELFQEKRAALITRVVTKGLNPNVPMKHSGVEWLGAIPADWSVRRLKMLISDPITDGPHETPEFLPDGVPFLSVDGIQQGELVFEGCRYISEDAHKEYRRKCAPRRDDILLGKAASTGKIARVKVDSEFSVWSPLALIRPNDAEVSPGFLEYALKSAATQAQIDILCTSNTQKNISMRDIPILVVCIAALQEQRAIATFLDRETGRIDALIDKVREAIDRLKELRSALISAAVTGKIDVRAA